MVLLKFLSQKTHAKAHFFEKILILETIFESHKFPNDL